MIPLALRWKASHSRRASLAWDQLRRLPRTRCHRDLVVVAVASISLRAPIRSSNSDSIYLTKKAVISRGYQVTGQAAVINQPIAPDFFLVRIFRTVTY